MSRYSAIRPALTLFVALVLACTSIAQPSFSEATSTIPVDFEDVLYSDCDSWAQLWFDFRSTGLLPTEAEDFDFGNSEHLPIGWVPFANAYDTFEALYTHRLQLDPDSGDLYLLDDLLVDDPQVFADFRVYVTTGELRTPVADPNATVVHLDIIDGDGAVRAADLCLIEADEGIWVEAENLVSQGAVAQNCKSGGGGGGLIRPDPCDQLPPEWCEFFDELEDQLRDSRLPGVPYESDRPFFWPGFDCDDYCEAFWAWLEHRKLDGTFPPDAEIDALWLWWRFTWGFGKGGKHGKVGHAIFRIRVGNFFYLVDPMGAQIYGPFPVGTPLDQIDFGPLFDNNTPNDPSDDPFPPHNPTSIQPREPTDRPWNDPAPWHSDPDMRDHLRDGTGRPAGDYTDPNAPPPPDDPPTNP